MAGSPMRGAKLVTPPALPDDRRMQRPTGCSVEYDDRFALIRDADARDLGGSWWIAGDKVAAGVQDVLPDFLGIVLYPAGLRIMLPMRPGFLVEANAVFIEQQRFGCRGTLVDGKDAGHVRQSPSKSSMLRASPSIEIP